MAKTIVKASSGQVIIASSDGKDAPLPVSAGQPIVAVAAVGSSKPTVHGQVTGTTVVTDNPA